MVSPEERRSEQTRRRRRGRVVLVAIGIAAVAAIAAPSLIRGWMMRDLCPTEVTARGEVDGAAWDVARSTCEAGRIVWQLRIVPAKGVSTLVYEAEGGPAPASWSQSGFRGEVRLAAPLGDGTTVLPVKLDVRGRPLKPVRVRQGSRVD